MTTSASPTELLLQKSTFLATLPSPDIPATTQPKSRSKVVGKAIGMSASHSILIPCSVLASKTCLHFAAVMLT